MVKKYKPVILVVLDGFGVNVGNPESTWKHAKMPTFRELEKFFPFTTLQASGIAVGLPWGEEGNSEVGHLTLGAGKPLYHHLPRIITSIHNGSFFQNRAFLDAADFVKKGNGKMHLMGLFSSGSVHAYIDHLYALLDFCNGQKVNQVYLHLFTDGKDAPTKEAGLFLKQLDERLAAKYPFAKIATVAGRYFALDRDENWDRIEKFYKCLTLGEGEIFKNAPDYVEASYGKNITDELIPPASLGSKEGRIEAGDAVIFYNYREDSERELTSAFVLNNFSGFSREKINNLFFVTMTEYDKRFPAEVAFPPMDISWPLARIISEAGLKQLHIAETEKYAHITYFFNGLRDNPYPNEFRILIPSKAAIRHEENPEMMAKEITDRAIIALREGGFDFILINYANPDLIAHTGNYEATIAAVKTVDRELGRLVKEVLEGNHLLIVTSDHGNAESVLNLQTGEPETFHDPNPVPIYLVAREFEKPFSIPDTSPRKLPVIGILSDVAPTLLELMKIPKPEEMTGESLLSQLT